MSAGKFEFYSEACSTALESGNAEQAVAMLTRAAEVQQLSRPQHYRLASLLNTVLLEMPAEWSPKERGIGQVFDVLLKYRVEPYFLLLMNIDLLEGQRGDWAEANEFGFGLAEITWEKVLLRGKRDWAWSTRFLKTIGPALGTFHDERRLLELFEKIAEDSAKWPLGPSLALFSSVIVAIEIGVPERTIEQSAGLRAFASRLTVEGTLPRTFDILVRKADAAMRLGHGQYEEALQMLDELRKECAEVDNLDPLLRQATLFISFRRGKALKGLGRTAEATQQFRELIHAIAAIRDPVEYCMDARVMSEFEEVINAELASLNEE